MRKVLSQIRKHTAKDDSSALKDRERSTFGAGMDSTGSMTLDGATYNTPDSAIIQRRTKSTNTPVN
jgi:hypothetical protein